MNRLRLLVLLPILLVAGLGVLSTGEAQAQGPAVVTAFYPAPLPAPIVTYFPERRGLFGLQTVYRPVVTYAAPTPPVVVPAPATAVFYAAPAPVTAYRVPARVVLPPPPVAVYYPPAPVVTHYAPVHYAPVIVP